MDPCIVDDSVEIPTRCRSATEFIIPKFIGKWIFHSALARTGHHMGI
jgi:hypothetical protein